MSCAWEQTKTACDSTRKREGGRCSRTKGCTEGSGEVIVVKGKTLKPGQFSQGLIGWKFAMERVV